jgi:hypothetical protein
MDVQISIAFASLGILAFISPQELYSRHTFLIWATCLAIQYLLLKVYRIFIYPFYVSPLRHLPGPKVRRLILRSELQITKIYALEQYLTAWPGA